MNELFYSLLFIIIIIVLILIFILVSYFYNSYDDNKKKVDANFDKTTDYINNTNKTLSGNLNTLSENVDKLDKRTTLIDTTYSNITTKTNLDFMIFNTSNSNNIFNLQNNYNSVSTNISNYDNNLKQFFEFRDNAKTTPNKIINEALFNYKFSVPPNLSMSVLRDINIASSLTVNTNNTNKFFRVCDDSSSNCIDLNVNQGSFNIKPSDLPTNNINNLNITNKNNQSLANFDFANNSIYLGSNGENAGMFIKGNKVYVKDLYLLNNGTNYSATEQLYDDINPTQPYNMYKLNNASLVNIPKIINLEYTINKVVNATTPPTTIYNISINLSSKVKIPMNTNIEFFIDGLTYVSTRINNIQNATSGTRINNLSIDGHKGILTLNGDVEPSVSQIYTANNINNISFLDPLTAILNKKIIINF
jgi:archaellum component FlaC